MTKTKTLKINRLEKVLITAGLMLVTLSIVAAAFSLVQNFRFVHLPFDVLFYLGNAIIIGGGFGAGYVLFKRRDNADTPLSAGMNGLVYSLAGYMIFILIDRLRVLFNPLIDRLDYPLPAAIFSGMPLIALVVTVAICFVLQKARPSATKWLLISLFAISQIATLVFMISSLLNAEASIDLASGLVMILSIAVSPAVVAVVTYIALKGITSQTPRLFYAVVIGLLPTIAGEVAWSFRTDPTLEATEVFANIIGVLMLLAILTLLFFSRRAIKR